MRFLDSSAFLLLTIWGLRIAELSALNDPLSEGTFDDTFSNDEIAFAKIPGVGNDDLFRKSEV